MKHKGSGFLAMIKALDGLDYLYIIGVIVCFAGLLLQYGLSEGLIFAGAAIMVMPVIYAIINRGQ